MTIFSSGFGGKFKLPNMVIGDFCYICNWPNVLQLFDMQFGYDLWRDLFYTLICLQRPNSHEGFANLEIFNVKIAILAILSLKNRHSGAF